jgi:hypothetical protein
MEAVQISGGCNNTATDVVLPLPIYAGQFEDNDARKHEGGREVNRLTHNGGKLAYASARDQLDRGIHDLLFSQEIL